MLEIQSFMREFEALLERKAEDRQGVQLENQRLVDAVDRLERNL